MNNQIEEIAKDIALTPIGTVNPDLTLTEMGEVYKSEFILRIARHLYNAGYRKQSEVAAEIFAELEGLLLDGAIGGKYSVKVINPDKYAELKKKYTEGENDL
jgi:hypothetical protein